MCTRLGCPFQSIGRPADDGILHILIFGVTGMTGTAVLSAALACIWFKITVFTRRMNGPVMEEILTKPLARIVEGDMFNYDSVLDAMTGADAVFFSTTYWDTMRVDCEFSQGFNVLKAAMEVGVKHVVYVGTPYCSLYAVEKCKYLMGKEKVEAHLVASGLPYTIFHLGFYYENFLSVFRPHMVEKDKFALALPMEDVPLNCGSVIDFGHCIAKIMLRPHKSLFKTIKLATGYHTVSEMAQIMDDHFKDLHFYDPRIPVSAYRSFDFKGAQELASMFAYFQSIEEQWPQNVAHDLYGSCISFKDWIVEEEGYLIEVMHENQKVAGPEVVKESPRWSGFHSKPGAEQMLVLPKVAYDNVIGRAIMNVFGGTRKLGRTHSKESNVDTKIKGLEASTPSRTALTNVSRSSPKPTEEKTGGLKSVKTSETTLKDN